jgi:hypothetical protein
MTHARNRVNLAKHMGLSSQFLFPLAPPKYGVLGSGGASPHVMRGTR